MVHENEQHHNYFVLKLNVKIVVLILALKKKIPNDEHLIILTLFSVSYLVRMLNFEFPTSTVTSYIFARYSAYCFTTVSTPPISGEYILLTINIFSN